MAFAWLRPVDTSVVQGRPLLDVGTGDGQTLAALAPHGLRVGVDQSFEVLRAAKKSGVDGLAAADASQLPFSDETFGAALATDLFHHFDDTRLCGVLREVRRVLKSGGTLVAWWYAAPGRPSLNSPRYPRAIEAVASLVSASGFHSPVPIELESALKGPPTVGLSAQRR